MADRERRGGCEEAGEGRGDDAAARTEGRRPARSREGGRGVPRSLMRDRPVGGSRARPGRAASRRTTMASIQPSPRRRSPMSIGSFARYPLLFGPSPVQPLGRLSKHLGGAAVWAKRDDCNSGIAFGGNKTRKLEYLVADALETGCDTLVSIGGVQSNHTRQVAAVAAHVGLGCVLIQESWVDWPDSGLRPGRQHPHQPAGRRGRAAGEGRLRDRVQGELGAGAGRGPRSGREAVRHPGRRLRSPARRSRLRELGLRGRRPGARARGLLRHDHRLLGDRAAPRPG